MYLINILSVKNSILVFILFTCVFAQAQYYYNDIVATSEMSRHMKNYVSNNVKQVVATGYEPNGVKSSDFNEWHDALHKGTIEVESLEGHTSFSIKLPSLANKDGKVS